MTARRYVTLRGAIDTAEIRVATFRGAEHLVVPVVAMVGNSVVSGLGSAGPEFVPAEELAVAPGGWNGRPVVPDHPAGGTKSANDPATLEAMGFGVLFNTRFEDNRLRTEAWLDLALAESVGEDALERLSRARAKEPIEVSVGAWIVAEKHEGEHNGQEYVAIWRDIIPDHLALLPPEATGACSIDMGCGAPRVNQGKPELKPEPKRAALRAAEEDHVKNTSPLVALLVGLFGKAKAEPEDREPLRKAIKAAQDSMSDSDLRQQLWGALQSVEPGFDYILDVFPGESLVVYQTWTEQEGMHVFTRTYAVGSDDEVTLNDDRTEVEPVTRYEPVAAQAADSTEPGDSRPCSCKNNRKGSTPEGETMTEKIKELVGRLVANEASPFTEADVKTLEAFSEDRLTEIAASFETEPEPAAKPAEPEAPKGVQLSDEEYQEMKAAASAWTAQKKAEKAALVKRLAAAQKKISEEKLTAKPLDELRELAAVLEIDEPTVPDYSGQGDLVTAETSEPPRPYTEAMKRAKGESAPAN